MAKSGRIILSKNIKMDKNYKSVLGYSESQMISLLTDSNNLVYQATDYSFIRDRGTIKINCPYSVAIQSNYMAFQNSDYSGKWFFAFIDEVKFLGGQGDDAEIVYTIDVWSTWWDYWNPKACLVLREHVVDDSIGSNTVPESIELGEYIINAHLRDSSLRSGGVVLATPVLPTQPTLANIGAVYGGIYSGFKYWVYGNDDMTNIIQDMADNNASDAIISLFIAPSFLLETVSAGSHVIKQTTQPTTYDLGVSPITSLNGYNPINQKLLTYPFCYISASNGSGANAIYHQELFTNTNQSGEYVFRVFGVLTPGCSIKCVPINYKGSEVNTDEGINLGKFPQCSWSADMYTNWITQNGVNVATNIIGSSLELLTGNVQSGLTGLTNSMDQIRRAEMIPPQTGGNVNSGDILTAMTDNTFHFYRMTIKQEFAERIDQYFTRLGYRVNKVKIPNMTHRQNYNYVQVAQEENVAYPNNHNNICLPATALNEINNLFRNGVTIWNNHTNFGDYSVSNTITS